MSVNAPEFVDTNVLVYAHDASAGDKRQKARTLLDRLWSEESGALSVQVLQEFFVVTTRKLQMPLAPADARSVVEVYSTWRAFSPSPADVVASIDAMSRLQLGYWDALIVHSARMLGCRIAWSEDLNAGQSYDGVEVRDPFA